MPPQTQSIDSVRRERNRLTELRLQIREALATKGTLHAKRAIRGQMQSDRDAA